MELHDREQNLLRQMNIALIASLLRQHQPLSRVDLAERSGLGRSTVTNIVSLLAREGLVVETGEAASTGGRKPILLELVPEAGTVVSIRLAPRVMALGLVNLGGQLLVRQRRALRGAGSPEDVLTQAATWVTELLREHGPERGRVIGASVAIPGRVDGARGMLLHSSPLDWHQVPVQARLEEKLRLPVLVESDVNAFLAGERSHSSAAGADHVLGVIVGGSVRGGFILEGQICRGAGGGAGEIGHVVVDPDGPACYCGRRGCLEALVCDSALVSQAQAALDRGADSLLPDLVEGCRQAITREVLVAAAQDGDRLSLRLLEQAGHRIGQAAAQVANATSPEVIVLGGDAVEQAGRLLVNPIREALEAWLAPWVAARLKVAVADQSEVSILLGAGELVLARVFGIPGPLRGVDPLSLITWLPEEA